MVKWFDGPDDDSRLTTLYWTTDSTKYPDRRFISFAQIKIVTTIVDWETYVTHPKDTICNTFEGIIVGPTFEVCITFTRVYLYL